MNYFGGDWTRQKIEIVVDYAKAYLTIMNKYPQFKTLYFDGFAGSGSIVKDEIEIIKGAAIRVLEIDYPKTFDTYYFVEKSDSNKELLQEEIESKFSDRNYFIVNEDCNQKLNSMASFLKKHTNVRVLAFIDPFGMSVNWTSISCLKNLGVDLWILVPTGIGVNRLLNNDGNIPDEWFVKLEKFLGISRDEIRSRFYKEVKTVDLFGDSVSMAIKETNCVQKINDLYRERLLTIFKYASEAFVLRNSTNSIMYHFMMATNNKSAFKIANDIIKPKFKL
ncbi:MAG TPA: hypothetical protein DHW64_04905 [Chitinophagaceae bacterium]|nr:hypothetical protein [Chitinophagaceae bacterium]